MYPTDSDPQHLYLACGTFSVGRCAHCPLRSLLSLSSVLGFDVFRIDDMGARIDDLEHNINDLMVQVY